MFGSSLISDAMVEKAKGTIKAGEDARRQRVKAAVFKILHSNIPDQDIDAILDASRQSDSIRGLAGIAGKNSMIGEIISKIADALEGR